MREFVLRFFGFEASFPCFFVGRGRRKATDGENDRSSAARLASGSCSSENALLVVFFVAAIFSLEREREPT